MDFVAHSPELEEPLLSRWELSSSDSRVRVIESALSMLEEALALDERDRFVARLCLDEALTNACEHGANPEGDPIHFELRALAPCWVFRVRDSGPGFRAEDLTDPVAEPYGDRGRGLAILDGYAEQLVIAEGGREVTVRVRVRGGAE